MRYAGGISLPPVQKLVATITYSNPSSSAIRFTLDSSESRGFFFLFAFDVQNVLNFKGGFFYQLAKAIFSLWKLDNHFTDLVFWILHKMDMMKP